MEDIQLDNATETVPEMHVDIDRLELLAVLRDLQDRSITRSRQKYIDTPLQA